MPGTEIRVTAKGAKARGEYLELECDALMFNT
jgi:hypothetical protein